MCIDSNHIFQSNHSTKTQYLLFQASSTSLASADSVARKKSSWYNAFNPNYKRRADDFKKTFPTLPSDERLIVGTWLHFSLPLRPSPKYLDLLIALPIFGASY